MKAIVPGSTDGMVEATGKLKCLRKAVFATAVASLFFAPGVHETEAAMSLNFIPDDGTYNRDSVFNSGTNVYVACSMSYITSANCSRGNLSQAHIDGTSFFMDLVKDTATNKIYYHMIMGDYRQLGTGGADPMVQEYMIEATNASAYQMPSGNYAVAAYADNSSTANATFSVDNPYKGSDLRSGIGSGNPTRIIMNQILFNSDGSVSTQFMKGISGGTVAFAPATDTVNKIGKGQVSITGGTINFNSKPIITQYAVDAQMDNRFTIDMRAKTYQDGTLGGAVIQNVTNLKSGGGVNTPAGDSGDYDTTNATFTPYLTNQHNPHYTAGAYTYTDGPADTFRALGGGGTYNYDIASTAFVESGFVPMGKDYTPFCEPTVNPDWQTSTSNIIGGPKACSNGGVVGGKGRKGW